VSYIIQIKFYEINFEDLVISTAVVWDVTPSSLVDMMVQTAGSSKTLALHVYLPDMMALHSIRVFVSSTVTVIVEPQSSAPRIPRHGVQYGIPHSNGSDTCNQPS
jgi:hypothetical protein